MSTKCIKLNLGQANVYALTHRKTVLIDTGMPGSWKRIKRFLVSHQIGLESISLIIITHAHEDHLGALKEVHDALGVPIMMHAEAARCYCAGRQEEVIPANRAGRFVTRFLKKEITHTPLEVEHSVSEEITLEPFGVAASVLATPGHTPGSLSIVLPDNSAIIGDLLMGHFLHYRAPMKPLFANDMQAVKTSCEELLARGIERFLPGHGGPFSAKAVNRVIRKI